ncbi:MAG: hypothetical protein ACRDIB_07655, partial [Ardenticatenaceae bacterium]
ATLEPGTGKLFGQAKVEWMNTSSHPLDALPVGLNRGLTIIDITATHGALEAQPGGLWRLDPPLAPGSTTQVRIAYHGTLVHARSNYQIQGTLREEPEEIRAYVGQDAAFLLRDADWYPFSSVAAPQRLEITVPAAFPVVATADQAVPSGNQQTFIWKSPQGLPVPLLAAAETYARSQLGDGNMAYLPEGYEETAKDIVRPFVHGARYLDRWLLGKARPVTIAAVPLITTVASDPQSGILFLPEATFRRYAFTPGGDLSSANEQYTRWAMEELGKAWWHGARGAMDPCRSDTEGCDLARSLVSYWSLMAMDDLLPEEYTRLEIEARREALAAIQAGHIPAPALPISTSAPHHLVLLLHDLRTAVGDEAFQQIMRRYVSEERDNPVPISIETLADLVRRESGYDITPLLREYRVR